MGHLRIEADRLTIEVNSQQRAEAIKRKIGRRLGKRAVFRHAVIESLEKILEERQANPPAVRPSSAQVDDQRMNSPEVQRAIKEMAERHWRDWLDSPLPVLKGQTPRQAAATEIGRERLEAVLMHFAQLDQGDEPFAPDLDALRGELGLS